MNTAALRLVSALALLSHVVLAHIVENTFADIVSSKVPDKLVVFYRASIPSHHRALDILERASLVVARLLTFPGRARRRPSDCQATATVFLVFQV